MCPFRTRHHSLMLSSVSHVASFMNISFLFIIEQYSVICIYLSNPKERQCQRMFKSLYSEIIHSFQMLARLCSKSFNLGFSSTLTKNFQMYKLDFEGAEDPQIKLPALVGSWRKQKNFRKRIYFCLIDYAKAFDGVDQNIL